MRHTIRCQAQHDDGENNLHAAQAENNSWRDHVDVVKLQGGCKCVASGRMQEGCRGTFFATGDEKGKCEARDALYYRQLRCRQAQRAAHTSRARFSTAGNLLAVARDPVQLAERDLARPVSNANDATCCTTTPLCGRCAALCRLLPLPQPRGRVCFIHYVRTRHGKGKHGARGEFATFRHDASKLRHITCLVSDCGSKNGKHGNARPRTAMKDIVMS
jgi:hypothetical protein